MKVVVLQSNYLPWIGYFDLINDADVFCFYDEVKYTKNDWRNRNKIYSKNGIQWLTIPINKDAVKQKISEVEINGALWQELHFKTLLNSYRKANYFHQLEPLLEEFYKNNEWKNLSELNQYSIKYIAKILDIKTKFINSKDFDLQNNRIDRLINLVVNIGATEYISGPSAKGYLDGSESYFLENSIKLTYKSYPDYPSYKQNNLPFERYVSIVDLIAHVSFDDIKTLFINAKK